MNNLLLQASKITKVYQEGKQQTPVLHGVDFELYQGEMLAVVGQSGSGKSTLMHILGLLDKPTSGSIICQNQDLLKFNRSQAADYRNKHLGFVYQFHHLLAEFSALENVAMPLLIAGESVSTARVKAQKCLEQVGLGHRIKHRPAELSGGERQRVAIARAIVHQPQLVLADEPTGNLDYENGQQIFALLRELNCEIKTSFMIVTHDLLLAQKMDRQVILRNGQVVPNV